MTDQPVVVTFDFHNTIARCDRWFALEIRELVPAFLDWHAARQGAPAPADELLDAGRLAYRTLRTEIGETGIEQDAVSCLLAVLPPLGIVVTEDEVRLGVDELMAETFDEDVSALPGVVGAVTLLASSGVRLGIISSAVYTPFLHWALARFGIDQHFAVVVTSAEAGYYKSHPEIYRLAAAGLGAEPTSIVHVGDSFPFDVVGARRAGFRTVWVRGDRQPPDGAPAADLTLADLVDAGPRLLALARSVADGGTAVDG